MKEEIKLEQYYSGDENWNSFVNIAKVDFIKMNFDIREIELLILKLMGNDDLAYVIYCFFNKDGVNWLERKIPILDYLTPLECLQSVSLIRRLREALLRTPL